MPPQEVEAELQRRGEDGTLVNWILATDAETTTGAGKADPVIDFGVRSRLTTAVARLTSLLAALPVSLGQKTKAGSLSVTLSSDQDALATRLLDPAGAAYTAQNRIPVDFGGQVNVGNLAVTFSSVDSTANSSDTPLAANASFIGQWEDVRDFATISAFLATDVASATNGVIVEFTDDPAMPAPLRTKVVATTFPGGTAHFSLPPQARYFRVTYINGPTPQTYLRTQTILKFNAAPLVQQPLASPITDANMAGVTKAHLAGRRATGQWKELLTSTEGYLSTRVENFPTTQQVAGNVTLTNPTETGLALDTTLTTRLPPALDADGGLVAHIQNVVPVTAAALTDGTQRSRIVNSAGTAVGVEPFSALQVNMGVQTLFYDAWSSSPIDTVTKWTVTGNAPTIAGGNMQMSASIGYHAIRTKDTIRPNAGFTLNRNGVTLEASIGTGCGRFWGLGTPATLPSATSLVQDGIGYEVDQNTGALQAVTYATGVKTVVATLAMPTDGLTHAYGLYFRVTAAYWVLDGVTVATQTFPNMLIVELPAIIVRNNGASFTGAAPVMVSIAFLTGDTSRQGQAIIDPVVGTRMARVSPDGSLKVAPTIGTYGGQAGISGTVNVPAGAVVRSYAAQSGAVPASLTVPGVLGTITVPGSNQASTQFADNPDPGTMLGPCVFQFSATASYVVVWTVT